MPCQYEKAFLDIFFQLIIKTFFEFDFHAIARKYNYIMLLQHDLKKIF